MKRTQPTASFALTSLLMLLLSACGIPPERNDPETATPIFGGGEPSSFLEGGNYSDFYESQDSDSLSAFNFGGTLEEDRTLRDFSKEKVKVLLPLSGPFKAAGQAVKEGVLTAFFATQDRGNVEFKDTYDTDINQAYQQAISDSVSSIIGPLTKQNAKALNPSNSVKTIVLNPEGDAALASVMDLSIEGEIQQLLTIAAQRGYCRSLVITLQDPKGKQRSETFSAIATLSHMHIVDSIQLPTEASRATALLQKKLATQQRLSVYEDGTKVASEVDDFPFVRQDVDVVLISVPTDSARLLKPVMRLLGGSIPILSTSELANSERFNPQGEPDLKGIEYLDMPFRYEPGSAKNLFFQMGRDAYLLHRQLSMAPSFNFSGQTGSYVSTNQRLSRLLNLYSFDQGAARISYQPSINLDL